MLPNTKLVDLDCTLINSALRSEIEIRIALEHGVTPIQFLTARERVVAKFGLAKFSYEHQYVECRAFVPGLPSSIVEAWYEAAAIPIPFPDIYEFFGAFPREELVLLTAGHAKFQNIKIDAHSLQNRFSEILIVPSPKCNAIADPPPGTVFIDDSPREIDAMKLLHPSIFCIQVRTPAPWESQRVSEYKNAYAADLLEAVRIIKNRDRLI